MIEWNNLPDLPKGWIWTSIGAISKIVSGDPAPQGKDYFDGGKYPFVRVQDMGNMGGRVYLSETNDNINDKAALKMRLFAQGTVLFTKSGMSILLNQRAILGKDMYVVSHIGAASPYGGLPSEWLFYWLKTIDFKDFTHATTLPSLQLSKVQEIPVPLPPLPEQRRIVAKIEELFTRLDAGVEALKKTKKQLKRYRQAVLKYAFEGKLTSDWREAHKAELEPATALLERIREERKKKLGVKYKELPPVYTSVPPGLPEGWVWIKLEEVGEVSGGLTKNSKQQQDLPKMPYLRVANVYSGELRLQDIANIGVRKEDIEKNLLKPGDLLVVEGNGSADQIGRVAIWDGSISPCLHQNHIIKVRFSVTKIGKCVLYWLLSVNGRLLINKVSSSTSGLYTLSISKVSNLDIPLAPLSEQHKITEEIERHFSIAYEIEKTIDQSLKQAERLRQSILKRAFEGGLVPQDPSDEPAEKLLERIKAEKTKLSLHRSY